MSNEGVRQNSGFLRAGRGIDWRMVLVGDRHRLAWAHAGRYSLPVSKRQFQLPFPSRYMFGPEYCVDTRALVVEESLNCDA